MDVPLGDQASGHWGERRCTGLSCSVSYGGGLGVREIEDGGGNKMLILGFGHFGRGHCYILFWIPEMDWWRGPREFWNFTGGSLAAEICYKL
jgi:hypothetical protein